MASKITGNRTTIDYTIGLPPGGATDDTIQGRTQVVMENSMPIAKIYPGVPSLTKGPTLYRRRPLFRSGNKKEPSYLNLLNSHGFDLSQPQNAGGNGSEGCLTVAYLADSFPTDSFTNDYGENFLQSLTNIASEGAASLAQMRGARSFTEMLGQTTGALKKQGGIPGVIGSGLETAGKAGRAALEALLPKSVTGGIDVVSSMMGGGRLDFPMLWKGSGFQPSYTMTVRLYNPNPGSVEMTKKYIAGPIAAIMLLAIPITTNGITYSWPFIHRIVSPGIFNLDPAFISNITVIKGGDQQQIAYNQGLGVVDVRIDFGSLYSSMVASINDPRPRPTLKTYLDAMVGDTAQKSGVRNFSTIPGSSDAEIEESEAEALRRNERIQQTKNQSATQTELSNEEKDNPESRVSTDDSSAAAALLPRQPNIGS